MSAVTGVRVLPGLILQQTPGLIEIRFTSPYLPRRLFSVTSKNEKSKAAVKRDNDYLLESLTLMGVDVMRARKRHPGVLRKLLTNEKGLSQFLQNKGASKQVIASIITRYPRAITRLTQQLEQRWQLLRSIFKTDEQIINVIYRSPESFFRSSNNENFENNISYLTSIGLDTKDLHRLLTRAPRTLANTLELNKQMVTYLEDVGAELGATDPKEFVRAVICKNLFILIRSKKRIKENADLLRKTVELSDSELLALFQGNWAEVFTLSNVCMEKNLNYLKQVVISQGFQEADFREMILKCPKVLYRGGDTLSSKLECLLKEGITMEQILMKPRVLEISVQTIRERLEKLRSFGYNFEEEGIFILYTSQKRYEAKLELLAAFWHK
ncbi:transcription termination factor 1, mitochondrial [Aulostomus maculatus]